MVVQLEQCHPSCFLVSLPLLNNNHNHNTVLPSSTPSLSSSSMEMCEPSSQSEGSTNEQQWESKWKHSHLWKWKCCQSRPLLPPPTITIQCNTILIIIIILQQVQPKKDFLHLPHITTHPSPHRRPIHSLPFQRHPTRTPTFFSCPHHHTTHYERSRWS